MPVTLEYDPTQRIKALLARSTGKAHVIAKIALIRRELFDRAQNSIKPILVQDLCDSSGYSIDAIVDLHVVSGRLIFACRRSDFPESTFEELQSTEACNRKILETVYPFSIRSRDNSYDFPVDPLIPRDNMDSLLEMEFSLFCLQMSD